MSTTEAPEVSPEQIDAMLDVLAYRPQLRDSTSITFNGDESSNLVITYTGLTMARSTTDIIAAVEALGLDPRLLKTITVTRREISGVRFITDPDGRRQLTPNGTEYMKETFTIPIAGDDQS